MGKIADPLRELVTSYNSAKYNKTHKLTLGEYEARLLEIADMIDREHDVRMRQSRDNMRKAACRYMSRVVEDYKHGRKWRRKAGK